MNYNLIVDSCCDMPIEMQKENAITIAPLSIVMDEKLFTDDAKIDMDDFVKTMKTCEKITSGSPSPMSYMENFKKDTVNFIVTLSSKVSGSFSSAMTAKNLAEDDNLDVHVFDSKTASAGQMLISIKVKELITSGIEKSQIISMTNNLIDDIKTYFVSQDLSNFIKSGRLGKVKGKILTVLGIRPILGADGHGEITLFTQARGDNQTVAKFIELIKNSGKETNGQDLVITHCNNFDLADKLKKMVEETFNFKNIIIAKTKGISSMYANDKGLIMAF